MTVFDEIQEIFTFKSIISSVFLAIIINIISSYIYQKAMEKSVVFHDTNIKQLIKKVALVTSLHEDSKKLLCFAFRGIGISVALLAATMIFLAFNNIISSYIAIQDSTIQLPKPPPCFLEEMKVRSSPSPECAEELKKATDDSWKEADNRRKKFLNNSQAAFFLFLTSFVVGVISVIYSINLYRTLKLVENFEEFKSQINNINGDF